MFDQIQGASSMRATTAIHDPVGPSRLHGTTSSSSRRKAAGALPQIAAGTLKCSRIRSMVCEHLAATLTPAPVHQATNAHMKRWLQALAPLGNVLGT